MDVGAELWEQAKLLRPDFIVCDSETCRWRIAKATGLPVYHPVQVLERAYASGRQEPESEGGRDVHQRLLGSILRCRPAEDGQICLSSDHGRLVQACQSQSPAPP
jgi:hypothetical protein